MCIIYVFPTYDLSISVIIYVGCREQVIIVYSIGACPTYTSVIIVTIKMTISSQQKQLSCTILIYICNGDLLTMVVILDSRNRVFQSPCLTVHHMKA